MRRLAVALALAALAPGSALAAGSTVNALTASPAIVGAQLVYCPIAATTDYKCTFTQVAAFNYSLMSQDCTSTGAGVTTCLKTNNVAFGGLATVVPGTGVAAAAAKAANLAAGGLLVNAGAPLVVAVRSAATSSVTVSATTDYFLCLDPTANAIAVALPASPATGLTYLVKDCTGQAAAHSITLTPAAGTIDGAATYVMSTAYGSIAVTYTGSQWSIN